MSEEENNEEMDSYKRYDGEEKNRRHDRRRDRHSPLDVAPPSPPTPPTPPSPPSPPSSADRETMRDFEMQMREFEIEQREMEKEFEREQREFEREMREFDREHRHLHAMSDNDIDNDYDVFRSKKRKNITIRGMKSQLYDDFSNKVQSQLTKFSSHINIGFAISKIIYSFNALSKDEFPTLSATVLQPKHKLKRLSISHQNSLSISVDDFLEADARFTFTHIKTLTFKNDITHDLMKKYVKSISHCESVSFPKTVPKLIGLALLQNCKSYNFY